MAERSEARRWLGRAAVAVWVVLGAGAVLIAPEEDAPSPSEAELRFQTAPSSLSSARSGTLAFARLLRRMGFQVSEHSGVGDPDADLLLLLEPRHAPSPEESAILIEWVRRGGRLVYAPGNFVGERATPRRRHLGEGDPVEDVPADDAPGGEAPAPGTPTGDEETEQQPEEQTDRLAAGPNRDVVDHLAAAIASEATGEPREDGSATLWRVGAGRAALLENGAVNLSNELLEEQGIRDQLGWLRWILTGARTVAFDEGRLGYGEAVGPWVLLTQSRFSAGTKLALLALFILLVARGARRQPAQPEPPAGGRAFGEHIDAVASVMRAGSRARLAGAVLVDGTRRRLGALAATPRATEVIQAAERALAGSPTPGTVGRHAARLRDLEGAIGLEADAADAARRQRV
jgi:hypothetical protein